MTPTSEELVLGECALLEVPAGRDIPRRPRFWVLWAATAGAGLGDGMLRTGLPLIAVTMTVEPTLIAGVMFAFTLPWAVLALPAGVLVDRVDRRWLVVIANAARAVSVAALLAAALGDILSLPMLYGAAFVIGAGETLTAIASTALVPAIVDRRGLESANARLLGTAGLLDGFAGPPLAGAAVALGATSLLVGGSALYAMVAAVMLLLHGSFRAASSRGSIAGDVREGLQFLWHQRTLRTLTLMVAVMACACSAWEAVFVIFAVHGPMHLSIPLYGLLLSAIAFGGLLGTALASNARRRFGARAVIAADILATATLLAVPAMTSDVILVALAMFVGGAGSGMWGVLVVSLRQRIVPDHLLGRVSATSRLFGWGTVPVGAALGGLLASFAGPRAVFGAGAVLIVLVALPLLRDITEADVI